MAARFSLEPNPAKDWVRFASSVPGSWDVKLIDALGRTIREFAVTERSVLKLDGITRGVYFIRLPNGKLERLVVD